MASKNNKKVLNPNFALGKTYTNKLATAEILGQNKIPQIKTFFPNCRKHILKIFRIINGPIVVKRLNSGQGIGIQRFEKEKELLKFFKNRPYSEYLFQEFIPYEKDIRVLTIAGQAIAALKRIPPRNKFVANISQGGKACEVKVDNRLKNISEKVARVLPNRFLGIDLIYHKNKYLVVEVNSSPGLKGYKEKTRLDIVQKIIDLLS